MQKLNFRVDALKGRLTTDKYDINRDVSWEFIREHDCKNVGMYNSNELHGLLNTLADDPVHRRTIKVIEAALNEAEAEAIKTFTNQFNSKYRPR